MVRDAFWVNQMTKAKNFVWRFYSIHHGVHNGIIIIIFRNIFFIFFRWTKNANGIIWYFRRLGQNHYTSMGKYAILWNNIGLPLWCTPSVVAITIIIVIASLCVYRRLRRRKFLTPSCISYIILYYIIPSYNCLMKSCRWCWKSLIVGAQLNFGLDVGGTLSKLVYFQPGTHLHTRLHLLCI